ncbi:MAG: hypothetical protein K1W18_07205 [Oscillospiraceae bacterium]
MNRRYLAAGIMLTLAFTLWFLATVRADAIGYYQLSDWALIFAGLLLCIGAFPVSGDLNEDDDEREDIGMEDKYYVTLDVTEQGLDGNYASQPHTYKKSYVSADEARAGINDLLWKCIEIEGIASGRILVECSIEKNGEYFDSDESELEIAVELTDKPSRYFADNRSPIPMSVDRAKSSCFVIE